MASNRRKWDTFEEKKLVENKIFTEKIFGECLPVPPIVLPKNDAPPNFMETFQIAIKL